MASIIKITVKNGTVLADGHPLPAVVFHEVRIHLVIELRNGNSITMTGPSSIQEVELTLDDESSFRLREEILKAMDFKEIVAEAASIKSVLKGVE